MRIRILKVLSEQLDVTKQSEEMSRTSPVHYIAPSAISIIPNANGSENDLSVYVARGAKIRVYSPRAGVDYDGNGIREWSLSGRNRRLTASQTPYTIYARISKTDIDDGYVVFAQKVLDGDVWKDKYPYVTTDGLASGTAGRDTGNYWYIRIGDVSIPSEGARTVTLDTGILGTEQFNTDWAMDPDAFPLRVEIGCVIDDEDVGRNPYVYWGKTLTLSANLVEGWTGTDVMRFRHWSITRNSGNAAADAAWLGKESVRAFKTTGVISLTHIRGTVDDFGGAVSALFTVTAWGIPEDQDDVPESEYVAIAETSVSILAETAEKYELVLTPNIIGYNPMTEEFSPAGGSVVSIRATDQRSDVFGVTYGQFRSARLEVSYAEVDSSVWTPLVFSGEDDMPASAVIPISAFAAQKSLNVRLVNADEKELDTDTVAFVRDGEDTRDREWIFLRSQEPITFGDASSEHPAPSYIQSGEVNPSGAAGAVTTEKNQEGWVPQGWWDEQQGTDADNPYEYGSYRDYIRATEEEDGHWGDFSMPKIWTHFGEDGIVYSILTDADNVSIPTDRSSVTTGFNAVFQKRAGSNDPAAYGCYYAAYRRHGNTYSRFEHSGLTKVSSVAFSDVAVSSDSASQNYCEAIVIYISDSPLSAGSLQSAPPDSYLTKKEIPVIKDGDTGPKGEDAYSVSINPGYAIFEETLNDGEPVVDTSAWVGTVQVMKGSTPQSFKLTYGQHSHCRPTSDSTREGVSVTEATIKFDLVKSEGSYSSEGYIALSVATDDGKYTTTNVKIPYYLSLLDTLKKAASKWFLSKEYDDTAKGNINFEKDVAVGGDFSVGGDTTIDGILHVLAKIIANLIESDNFNGDGPFDTGFELTKNDGTGHSYLVVDKLYVRLKAIFNELEIRKISYAGGNFIFSHAGSTIIAVKPTSGAWRCYMKADDGTTSTENWWHVNDQARCQEFGIQEPGVYQDFETRYYWRKVVAVGHENIALEEGQEPGEYNYVDLSVTDCESGSDEPKAGDRIVQIGNRTDLDRQGFISLEVDGEYAPAFKVYKNVKSYDLNNKRKICLSPKYTELRPQKLVIETEYDAKPVKIFRGAWSNITKHRCYYYDEVTHNDETWYCTFPESGIGGVKYTTEEPSDNAQYWVKEVAKGKDGKDGNSFNILGSYNTMAELIAEHPTGNVGNAYIVGSDLVVWDAENNRWKDVGQFKGDTGRGIASVVISYGKSSSSTVLPTTWVASVSDLDMKAGDYLFTRTIYRYDTGTPATSDPVYTIGYIGKDGKDGEGLPAAVLNLSDSVVEIETDENGAATKAFREEITYDMKASGKILYVKNISVPSASHVSVPSYYLSPLKQNAITVSGKVATMMGTVSGTVLTLNQKPDITRLPHIIVSANAGATISEGNVTLNGTAVDKDGKTYEAMNIFVIGRQYYAPALQVVLSQDTIILTQDENTKQIDLTGAYTNVSLRIGGTDITEGLAITVAAEHCNASVIANTVKIDAILAEEGVYYDRGYVDITISYKGNSYLKRWPFYCNLLGTWKESVENDTKEAIAQSTWWDLDESGNIVESERLGNFVQSSKENTARLEELNYVAVYTGTEKSFTLTAEQITKYGKNYRLVMDYACSSERVTITVKKGSTVIATFTNVLSYDTFDKELTNLSAGTYTITFSQTVTVGRIDVFAVSTNKFSEISQTVDKISLSVESKENINLVPDPDIYQPSTAGITRDVSLIKGRTYVLSAQLKKNASTVPAILIILKNKQTESVVTSISCTFGSAQTKIFTSDPFTITDTTTYTISIGSPNSNVILQWLQLEQGEVFTQHTSISSAFKRTGIDIENGLIKATTDNFVICNSSGTPTFSVDSDGNLVSSGSAKFSGTIEAKGGTIGGFVIGTSNIHSAAEDSSHNPLIQLNNDGSARIGGLVVANNGDATLTGTINATGGNISGNLTVGEVAAHRYHFEFKPKEAAGGTGSYSYYSAQLIGYSDNSATSKEEIFSIKMGEFVEVDYQTLGWEPTIRLLTSYINPYRFYFERTIKNKTYSIRNELHEKNSSLKTSAWRDGSLVTMEIGVVNGKCNIVSYDNGSNIGWITDSLQTPVGGVYVTEMLGRMVMCVRT